MIWRTGQYWRFCRLVVALAVSWLFLGGLAPVEAQEGVWRYSVRPGDNIWNVSRRVLTDWRRWPEVQSRNGIDQPRALPPGSSLEIPLAWLRVRPAPAAVLQVMGEASLVRSPGGAAVLSPGLQLQPGDRLTTGDQASLDLAFVDGSSLRLLERSEIILDRLDGYVGNDLVNVIILLEQGRIESHVQPRQDGRSTFELRSPAMISAVRGTDLRIAAIGDGKRGTTEVLKGRVATSAAGHTVRLDGGFGTFAAVGEPPAPPEPLLAAPDIASDDRLMQALPPVLRLQPVEGAVAYRVQVESIAAAGDASLLADVRGASPALRLPELADGLYRASARAIAASDLEGLDRTVEVEIDARPLPPALLSPTRDAKLREPAPVLTWAAIVDAPGYRVQLARDEGFADIVLDQALDASSVQLDAPLAEGRYFWRVATRDTPDRFGPFGLVLSFEKREPPPVPELGEIEASTAKTVLSLAPLEEGRHYQVQLATDSDMTALVADRSLDGSELTLTGLSPTSYYFRARVIEADGYEGAFGPAQKIDVPAWPYWPFIPLLALLALL